MIVRRLSGCTLSGNPGSSRTYIVGIDGYVQRLYGEPPELLTDCRRCGAATVTDGDEIVDKIFYGTGRRVHVWCAGHQPWWWTARIRLRRWRWKLFGTGTPLHLEPDHGECGWDR